MSEVQTIEASLTSTLSKITQSFLLLDDESFKNKQLEDCGSSPQGQENNVMTY